jgi:hypothetical protein
MLIHYVRARAEAKVAGLVARGRISVQICTKLPQATRKVSLVALGSGSPYNQPTTMRCSLPTTPCHSEAMPCL